MTDKTETESDVRLYVIEEIMGSEKPQRPETIESVKAGLDEMLRKRIEGIKDDEGV